MQYQEHWKLGSSFLAGYKWILIRLADRQWKWNYDRATRWSGYGCCLLTKIWRWLVENEEIVRLIRLVVLKFNTSNFHMHSILLQYSLSNQLS